MTRSGSETSAAPPRRPVFLIGFMATGKTTVGAALAGRLRLPFVDLDHVIEEDAGRPIPAIFADEGEAGFRRREAAALARLCARPAVVATGGGAPCSGDNLARMRASGLVVALTAPLDKALARVSDPSTRPLLARSRRDLEALYRERAPIYRQAHAGVVTDDRDPDQVAAAIAALYEHALRVPDSALPDSALVALEERTYPVTVLSGGLAALGEMARAALGDRTRLVALVSDENVAPHYAAPAAAALASAGFDVCDIVVPAGERAKSVGELARLWEAMVAGGLDRRSAVVGLGGGVVGDLAGFAAATLYRGVAVVHVPTTILAMVDSSIGGKTGINLEAGKNLAGSFWQPALVVADPDAVVTLPARERSAAFGELVKYALLDGDSLYQLVDALAPKVAEPGVPGALGEVIRRCAAIKGWIVSRDERETTGERALLNLGHTLGHAIESEAGYGVLLHGEAVALGLLAACRVSAALGLTEPSLEQRVADTVRGAGLDTDIDRWLTPSVLERVGVDKKRAGDRIRFVALRGVGEPELVDLALADLRRILRP